MSGSIFIGVRGWLIWTCLAAVAAAGLGSYLARRPPSPPGLEEWQKPCRDTVDVDVAPNRHCPHADHRMEIYPAPNNYVMVKCVCRPAAEKR